MKKSLVNYDSDEDANDLKTETIKPETNSNGNPNNKKKLDYHQLPISKPINLKENLKEIQKINNDPSNSQQAKTSKITINEKNVFNLPPPKQISKNPQNIEKSMNLSNAHNNRSFQKKTIDSEEKFDDYMEESNTSRKVNLFQQNIEDDIVKNEEIEENDEKNEKNSDKLLEFLNKRDKISKKGVHIEEIEGKQLLDFDWHGYRERQKIKKETSFQKNLKAPNKVQKTKHQLTYLAFEAISKQDEIEDRKNEARKNHLLTQQKYGW